MNISQINQPLHGVVQGIAYGQHERVEELNTRIFNSRFSDAPIKPQFDIRAVSTKYAHFPLVDRRAPSQVPYKQYLAHSTESNFCPGAVRGPADGFSKNIAVESQLRNQFFALQRGADQGVYVPSSTSDLYRVGVHGRKEVQTHPILSAQFQFDQQLHPNVANTKIGGDVFHNNTRTQLRSL